MRKEDYIPRGEAEKVLTQKAVADSDRNGRTWAKAICAVKDIPAADVEPKRKTGLWVGMREYCQHLFDTTGERYVMSQLGISLPHCNQCWAENESRKPFCPNCGAKMNVELPMEDSDAE